MPRETLCVCAIIWLGHGLPSPVNLGHWRCWDKTLRDGTFSGNSAFHLRVKALASGLPISTMCCDPWFGPRGNSACWEGQWTYELCCGRPILPTKCVGAIAHTLIEERGQVRGSKFQARETTHDLDTCGSLDDFAAYLSDPIIGGSDKFAEHHNYLSYYEPLLAHLGFNATILEIGIHIGHSLAMWSLWFPLGSVVGADISLKTFDLYGWSLKHRGANTSGNMRVLEVDSTSPKLVQALGEETFDVIVDDGSHKGRDQILTFEMLFPSKLRTGGWYMVEDVHYITSPNSSFNYFVEVARHAWIDGSRKFTSSKEARQLRHQHPDEWRYQVDCVTFRQDLIMIRKVDMP